MDIYLAGTAVSLTVPLQDRNGNAFTATAIDYRITNQAGIEVQPRTSLTTFTGGSEAVIGVPAELNAVATIDPATINAAMIDSFFVRESRTVELFVVDGAGNTAILIKSYALEPSETLIAGLNSFQSFSQAELVSLDIPQLNGWAPANEQDKIAALIEARLHV